MIDLEELYRRLGGDCKSVLQRIPSEAMVCKFVHKYADDPTYSQLQAAVRAADWETAFRAAHTMKGLAQNLGFERLYRSAAALPTEYFEAKPQRAVGFNEVLAAVIPDDSSDRLKTALRNAGSSVRRMT